MATRSGSTKALAVNNVDGVKVMEHHGGIEGFNTALIHVPEQRICVIVLANVNGSAPDAMSAQLLDIARGKTVTLNSERKAVPTPRRSWRSLSSCTLCSQALRFTVAQSGEGLTAQGTGMAADPIMVPSRKGRARTLLDRGGRSRDRVCAGCERCDAVAGLSDCVSARNRPPCAV